MFAVTISRSASRPKKKELAPHRTASARRIWAVLHAAVASPERQRGCAGASSSRRDVALESTSRMSTSRRPQNFWSSSVGAVGRPRTCTSASARRRSGAASHASSSRASRSRGTGSGSCAAWRQRHRNRWRARSGQVVDVVVFGDHEAIVARRSWRSTAPWILRITVRRSVERSWHSAGLRNGSRILPPCGHCQKQPAGRRPP